MTIPLIDLKSQYEPLKDGIKKEISEVLDSQTYILGEKVEAFEKNIAEYCKAKHALGVSSGTDALLMSLLAFDLTENDEVILPPFTFFATAGVVHRIGAKIVFADIDPDTFNINPKKYEQAITRKTRAVIPVHLFGQCCDMDKIIEISKTNSIKILEDTAQSIGSEYNGEIAGTMGDLGAFSCYPTKNLGAVGEAGFIITNDDELYTSLSYGRNHGQGKKGYIHKFVGGNFRMDAIQGAVLNYKLKYLNYWTEKRIKNAGIIKKSLETEKLTEEFISNPKTTNGKHIFNQYTVRVKNNKRDPLRAYLKDKGINTGVYYPLPLHLQECFSYLGYRQGDFPESEKASEEVLSLPVYPELSEIQIEYLVEKIKTFFKK